jgi:hypothetical protein
MRWRCVEEAAHNHTHAHVLTCFALRHLTLHGASVGACVSLVWCLVALTLCCCCCCCGQAHSLGLCLWLGEGTLVDLEEAKVWLAKSADQGVVMAAESLELLIQEQARETRV